MIPLFVLFAASKPLIGAVIFAFASITDLVDGYIARKSKQVTKLGTLLDPIADKLLVIAALIIFVDMELIPAWITIIITVREIMVTWLRVVALTEDIIIPAETGGKLKMTAQTISILFLLVDKSHYLPFDLYSAGIIMLWIAMITGLVSGFQYFTLFWRRM